MKKKLSRKINHNTVQGILDIYNCDKENFEDWLEANCEYLNAGACSKAYLHPNKKWVIKLIYNKWHGKFRYLRSNSRLKKFFIGYLGLSKDRQVCIQHKVINIGSNKLLKKFEKMIDSYLTFWAYDIHEDNIGLYRDKIVIFDF